MKRKISTDQLDAFEVLAESKRDRLRAKGWRKLDYKVEGDWMWQHEDGTYKKEGALFALLDNDGTR